jgi:choline dehydrogenase-like flavoprotein
MTVLLLEAGGSDRTPNVLIPAAFGKLFKTKRDWCYATDPEPHLAGRSLFVPRGKMLGGCSSMNAMIYIRGSPADFDGWAAGGATGWSYEEVLPYFRKAENNERGPNAFHGTDGPLNVAEQRSPNPLTETFIEAAVACGLGRNHDFNGEHQEGVGLYQVTQKNGRRWSTANAYLRPAMRRPNLTVQTQALARRVVIEKGRATGVEYERAGETIIARARGEVILSGGAVNSPQLLMLSGIGPADHVHQLGIDVLVANDHVGTHLQDHPIANLTWATTAKGTLAEAEKLTSLLRYLARRNGLLSSVVAEGGGFVRSHDSFGAPDLQLLFGPVFFQDHGFETYDGAALGMAPILLAPRSRGTIRLRSADPAVAPRISSNVLADRQDVEAMLAGIETVRAIARTRPLAGLVGEPLAPGPETISSADTERWLRRKAELVYHPSCSVRMGRPGNAAVNPSLQVYGVQGLRVVDASVMPTITRGNTNAPTIMIAEKAADLILADTTTWAGGLRRPVKPPPSIKEGFARRLRFARR